MKKQTKSMMKYGIIGGILVGGIYLFAKSKKDKSKKSNLDFETKPPER